MDFIQRRKKWKTTQVEFHMTKRKSSSLDVLVIEEVFKIWEKTPALNTENRKTHKLSLSWASTCAGFLFIKDVCSFLLFSAPHCSNLPHEWSCSRVTRVHLFSAAAVGNMALKPGVTLRWSQRGPVKTPLHTGVLPLLYSLQSATLTRSWGEA